MGVTQAYVNWSRVVADCSDPICYDAAEVTPGQTQMVCTVGHVSTIEWPKNLPAVLAALDKRVDPSKRNWFPKGHPLAVRVGLPQDQTPAELEQERRVHEQADADRKTRRTRAAATLQQLGLDADDLRALLADA